MGTRGQKKPQGRAPNAGVTALKVEMKTGNAGEAKGCGKMEAQCAPPEETDGNA